MKITWLLCALTLVPRVWANGDLQHQFLNPSDAARPRTYWFHMSGNITKPGITADLEAMKAVGLGGTLFMNVSVAMPQGLVENKNFMGPEWRDCYQHMLTESARLGLDFGSALCDGWGNAGGPDIPPELAMQMLTWSETLVRGGEDCDLAALPPPESRLAYYRDVAVLALPVPEVERVPPPLIKKALKLTPGADGFAEIRFDAEQPVQVREFTMRGVTGLNPFGAPLAVIECGDDGQTWRAIKSFPSSWRGVPTTDLTVAFDPVTARHFRVRFPLASVFRADALPIAQAWMSDRNRIHYAQAKSALVSHPEHGGGAERYLDAGAADIPGIPIKNVVNLTGKKTWRAPAGVWLVMRIGHTPTGAHNAPATPAGTGLECDKLDPRGVAAQHKAFVDKLLAAATPEGRSAFKHTWIDSWEVGPQNWTSNFPAEFKRRRGYDIIPWLPVVAGGRVLNSRDESERVLWDFRRTIADMFVDYYWKRSTALAEQRGFEFRAESFGRQQFMYDPMNYARANHMPCGEFWVGGGPRVDCKVAASAAHLSGRQIAGAEAFTAGKGNWLDSPWSLKTLGDRAFCLGVNQYYFHRYAHQPWLRLAPGMSFGPYGINFDRTSTWLLPGKAWIEYLTRCQSMLQQGRFVADVLVMLDEGAPSYGGWRHELAIPLPAGYDYDFANLDAVRESKVKDGEIVHRNGMRYRVLMLPGAGRATPALLRETLRLAAGGAWIAAPRPLTRAHGLASDEEVSRLWRKIMATGKVVIAENFNTVEKRLGLTPDFAHDDHGDPLAVRDTLDPSERSWAAVAPTAAPLLWIHRTDDAGADWYFVSNQSEIAGDRLCVFRVTGRQPELWDAATGSIRDVARFEERDGRTAVQIPFDSRGSWFVVFRKPASPLAVKPDVVTTPAVGSPLPPRNPGVTNTFTIMCQVSPAMDIELPKAADQGIQSSRAQNFAVHAEQGALMFGEGHVNAGLSVGRNGVVVWEHGARYLAPRVVVAAPVGENARIAVVYRDRQPEVYLNGALIGSAGASAHTVHPGGPGPFKGGRARVDLRSHALNAEQIAAWADEAVADKKPRRDLWIEAGCVIEECERSDVLALGGPWEVSFQAFRDSPAPVRLEKLVDLSTHAREDLRHFSGTAVYRTRFTRPVWPEDAAGRVMLDLGGVAHLAEVVLNGRNLGVLWKEPFRLDITTALQPGENTIEIRVTNLWVNRVMGDASKMTALGVDYNPRNGAITQWPEWVPRDAPPADAPVSFVTWRHWQGNEKLPSSGLLGPVRLQAIERINVQKQ